VRFPGFARLARRWWKTGAQEVWRDVVKAAFVKDLQKYVPAITSRDLIFGPSGVRAQAVGADGSLVDDFKLSVSQTSVHVLNAPSPAATASLAIAKRLTDEVDRAFGLTSSAGGRTSIQTSHRC
jgi:L-2-hydroxyglutarate oxidase LhgO